MTVGQPLTCLQQSGRRAQNLASEGGDSQKASQSSASACGAGRDRGQWRVEGGAAASDRVGAMVCRAWGGEPRNMAEPPPNKPPAYVCLLQPAQRTASAQPGGSARLLRSRKLYCDTARSSGSRVTENTK